MIKAEKDLERPVCIGHRGAAGHAPENTLLSIDKALELGADWIEIDIQLAQGQPVVIHNRRLDATTNGSGLVAQQDALRLRALNAGQGQGQGVPSLYELIAHLKRRAVLNIELKAPGSAVAVLPILNAFLARGWQPEDFLISSFDAHELRRFAEALPAIRCGLLIAGIPLDYAAAAQTLSAWSIHLHIDFVNTALIADAKARGLKVFVYTVNHSDDARWLLSLGVDGLFSDYPEQMRAVIDSCMPERAA
ncbi:MAG: glycerophosphodiester phosphodiesterase [Nevskiales bacterium]